MLRVALVLLVLVTLSCGARPAPAGGGAPAGSGVVRGTVLAWPCAPVETPDSPCPGRPAAEVDVTFSTAGRTVKTVRSDADGVYRVELEAGTYDVSVLRNRRIRSGTAVTVVAGQDVSMDIVYDSGLRLLGRSVFGRAEAEREHERRTGAAGRPKTSATRGGETSGPP